MTIAVAYIISKSLTEKEVKWYQPFVTPSGYKTSREINNVDRYRS
jgi:hypothetical protein